MTEKRNADFVDIFEYSIIIGNTELYLYDAIQELTDLKVRRWWRLGQDFANLPEYI